MCTTNIEYSIVCTHTGVHVELRKRKRSRIREAGAIRTFQSKSGTGIEHKGMGWRGGESRRTERVYEDR